MSSSLSRGHRSEAKKSSSKDGYDSLVDSEGPVSSVIRLPRPNASSTVTSTSPRKAPPPLPPKPLFARGGPIPQSAPPPLPLKPGNLRSTTLPQSAPPPLPPKQENVRGERIVDISAKARSSFQSPDIVLESVDQSETGLSASDFLPPPTRPVPAVPKAGRKSSYGEDGSWAPSLLDDRSHLDPPLPPEPTIVSDGEPILISIGRDAFDSSAQINSDKVPNLSLPLPAPLFSAQNHCISSLFQSLRVSEQEENEDAEKVLMLSEEGAEDVHIGAIVVSRERVQNPRVSPYFQSAPVAWRLYRSHESCDEAWKVLHEYLTNVSLKAHGRNRALQLLTGYVIGACLESIDAGMELLTEIVRRMRGAERSERDGSIFTLLVNVGAHVSFVQKVSWSAVEEVVRKVFSDVVEGMHGRQDDDVMWERALRCFLILLKSSDRRPSEDISSKCLAALALHVGRMTHPEVDHVLITEGLCSRIQPGREQYPTMAQLDVRCLEDIGGVQTVLSLFADTACPSARAGLFSIIYDFAVLKALEGLSQEDVDALEDHIITLRALLDTHEMFELLAQTFRVGPSPTFVMDTIRILLFSPLSVHSPGMKVESLSDGAQDEDKAFQEKMGSQSVSDTRLSAQFRRAYGPSAARYLSSTRSLLKLLDKSFCLKVLGHLDRMAAQNASVLAQREAIHFAREWKILKDIERHLQLFQFARTPVSLSSLRDILTKIYVAVVDVTSGRSDMKGILLISEMIIAFFSMKSPFSKRRDFRLLSPDGIPLMFLKGEITVSRQLLNQANPSMFTLLLLASQRKVPNRRLSESRQCLVEFLGPSSNQVDLLKAFTDDDDPAVAYRASEIVSKYSDINLQATSPGSRSGDAG